MCDNLIDLSIEDETYLETVKDKPIPSNTNVPDFAPVADFAKCLILTPQQQGYDSLDNNPFDRMQLLVNRPDDPFEIVEKEACFKAKHSSVTGLEVKMGKLLSLSDEDLLDGDDNSHDITSSHINSYQTTTATSAEATAKFIGDSTMATAGSTIYNSAYANDLDSESPPISLSTKWTPDSATSGADSGAGSATSTDGSNNSAKVKKIIEHRKRLLKLSISNSTFNSPVSRCTELNKEFLCSDQNNFSPISVLSGIPETELLIAESPLKFIDDDLMSEEPPSCINAERDFDADLEMLKIPILTQLPSSIAENNSNCSELQQEKDIHNSESQKPACEETVSSGLIDLNAIRAKLSARRADGNNINSTANDNNNSKNISLLIENLKTLLCDIENVDEQKRNRANSLLENLSTALATSKSVQTQSSDQNKAEQETNILAVPQKIVRQGTFDIDIKDNEEGDMHNEKNSELSEVIAQQTQQEPCPQPGQNNQEIPEIMFKSSATYDAEEKDGLNLPKVDPISPISPSSPPIQPDVNDIIEQLSKIFDQQVHNENDEKHTTNGPGVMGLNPTFIVVMNTPQIGATSHYTNNTHCHMNESYDDDFTNSSASMRRRSQSLSTHDKIKVLQIHMPPTPTKLSSTYRDIDRSPQKATPHMDGDVEFKTPSRVMPRRNSFSYGTPYTPMISNVGGTIRRGCGALLNKVNESRSNVVDTHEDGHRSTVRPLPMLPPSNNRHSLRPGLKKKIKTNESVMKSSVPLKATLPVKKVVPLLKSSPPTPEDGTNCSSISPPSTFPKTTSNTSMHLLVKSGKISHTSTPMPVSRSAGAAGTSMATGYPNACSTPSVLTTPMRRTGVGVNRPRYSHIPLTPTSSRNAQLPVAGNSTLKRRSLAELKTKSPIKPRVSIGVAANKTTKSSFKPQTTTSKTSNKVNSTIRTTSRVSGRASVGGSALLNKNKENKQP